MSFYNIIVKCLIVTFLAVVMLIDFLLSGGPFRLFHIYFAWIFAWLYVLETYIAFKIDEARNVVQKFKFP